MRAWTIGAGYGGRPGIVTAALAILTLTGPAAAAEPRIEQSFSHVPLFSVNAQLCVHAVSVCRRELQPLGVAIGGTFTVRIEDYYKSTYECVMVKGAPTWVATDTEGSCEEAPAVILPAQYDEGEAWNVG